MTTQLQIEFLLADRGKDKNHGPFKTAFSVPPKVRVMHTVANLRITKPELSAVLNDKRKSRLGDLKPKRKLVP